MSAIFVRRARLICALTVVVVAGALSGCATGPIGAHQPSIANVEQLRESGMEAIAVGEFEIAPGVKPQIDKGVSVRGSQLRSPANGSFAQYLKDSLVTELKSAGKYDAASTTVVSGELSRNELNAAGFSVANSTLAAKFKVHRSGASVYEKTLEEHQEWKSSFVGAIAIPEAINQYTEMYTKLLSRLFGDPDFRTAVTSPRDTVTNLAPRDDQPVVEGRMPPQRAELGAQP